MANKTNEDRIKRFGLDCAFGEKMFVRGHECVDLDLPSGTLWAKCNLGADKETEFGYYFQFGEFKKYEQTFKNYTPLEFDTANSIWGSKWKTPTKEQLTELVENTDGRWCSINNINGYKFTSKVDKSKYIFIPTAGNYFNGSLFNVGSYCFVWSSTPYGGDYAYCLYFYSGGKYVCLNPRVYGFSVRPVIDSTN